MQKVVDHVDQARRYITQGFVMDQTRRQANIAYNVNSSGDFPRSTAGILGRLNSAGSASPEGGQAPFASTASASHGVVGISTANTDEWVAGETVLITRPKYLDLSQATITVVY